MTHVKLMGEMGEKFGSEWECVDTNIRDIMKCIDVQVEGLKEYLVDCHNKNIEFSIQSGDTLIEEFPELYLNVARDEVIITPVPAGSGKGLGKLITGLLLLAAFLFMPGLGAAMTTGGTTVGTAGAAAGLGQAGAFMSLTTSGIATGTSVSSALAAGATLNLGGMAVMMLGTNLALMGLAEMSAPDPDKTTNDPSYLFNGAQNHIEQGKPVPLLYGELTIGGAPIYQGYTPGVRTGYTKGIHIIDGTDSQNSRIGSNPYSGVYTNYSTSNAGASSNQPSSGWVGIGNNTFDQVMDYITTPSSGLVKTPLPDDMFEQVK
jgi:predicted phage tail protein